MKRSIVGLALLLSWSGISAYSQAPFVSDNNTVALWHFDELSGNAIVDASSFHNNGTAYGAAIVQGRFGNGRRFNGSSAFASIPNPPNGSFNFGPGQSFSIEAWFRSTAGGVQEIVRRGIAPYPGYELRLRDGHAEGEIGNRWDGTPPDTVLRITSEQLFNDGNWHLAALVRDREAQKLFLYVDGLPAAPPMDDHFPYALSNQFAMDIGYWVALGGVEFFNGTLDEIRISNVARHPVLATSDTVALWHFDEPSGQSVHDSSPYHNNGTAVGTTIIPSEFGNARRFDGAGDYIAVPNSSSLNFNATQSFTITAWFKTSAEDTGEIVRHGLAPVPGFLLRVIDGRVQGTIGDREDMPPPSMLLRITSTAFYNDGNWHHAALVRDRQAGKLFLYVDGIQASPPLNDDFALPIANDRPLMIGRWENPTFPTYFTGDIDEVGIFRGARHPSSFFSPSIRVSPESIDFGSVIVNSIAERSIEIRNVGIQGTLHVTSILSSMTMFSTDIDSLSVTPGSAQTIRVRYQPVVAGSDTGSLYFNSNDPNHPMVRITLEGTGIQLSAEPIISSIKDIPGDQGKQVRVIWHRSLYDGANDSLHIQSYNLWRRVDEPVAGPYPPNGTMDIRNGRTYLYSDNDLWDFIVTVPAAQLHQYAYVAPTLFDSTIHSGNHWTTFRVSAHTSTSITFFSAPDSGYSVDNLPPHPPLNFSAKRIAGGIQLGWDAPIEPDIRNYVVHRSAQQSFVPSAQTLIGSPVGTNYTDTQVAGFTVLYYRVATVDSAGNNGEYSDEIGLLLTGTGSGEGLPTEYGLHQNYPNPFNPETIIEYDVPAESHVVVAIYDVSGKELERLVDDQKPAGSFRTVWKPASLATGVYFCRMSADTYSSVRKILLLK